MSNTQLLETIKEQKDQIARLNEELAKRPSIDYENKYKKALKDISGIIKANRQLKQEVDKLRFSRHSQAETYHQIQKQQFQKAFEKLLKEKQELAIANQSLEFERTQLKANAESLQEYVSELKSQQMNLAREKQALERNLAKKNSNPERPNQPRTNQSQELKDQLNLMKQRQSEYHKTILNFEQHHANLNRSNRQQEETINQLESKLAKNDAKWKAAMETKELEIHDMRSQIRREYQEQAAILKKQNAGLRAKISELSMKVQTLQIDSASLNYPSADRQQEMQLIYTLRELKGQMEPLRGQIMELQEGNQFQKQENMREKATLKMRVMELQAELYQQQEHTKALQGKLMVAQEKERNFEEQERMIKKLQEENRMLGGRVIVLESKDVALRNRNGQELEERVLQFQTRVEMLLSDKENLSNIKNVSIHQMIALKAYIMELDGKLKSLLTENEYSTKKYKNYKDKYMSLLKDVKKHQTVVNSYKNKIFGYDKLVVKLQAELERAMSVYDVEINSTNKVSNEETTTAIQIHRRRFTALKQKLELQDKYSKQQIETLKLNYETKLMEANIKLDEVNNLKETISLYKKKNEELVGKINSLDNEILDLKLKLSSNSSQSDTGLEQAAGRQSKQLIASLNLTISTKDEFILQLESEHRKSEEEWRRKLALLEKDSQVLKEQFNKPNSPMSRALETKIFELQQDVSRYKRKVSELQSQISIQQTMGIKSSNQSDVVRIQQLNVRISELQLDLAEANSKLESVQGTRRRLEQQIRELQDQNYTLQNNLAQQQREAKEKIQDYINSLSVRDEQTRSHSMQVNSSYSEVSSKLADEETKNHKLTLQIENLRLELLRNEDGNRKYIDQGNQLSSKFSELKFKYDLLNDQKERFESNFNRAELRRKQLEQEIRQKDDQVIRIQSDMFNFKARIQSYTSMENKMNFYDGQIDERDRTITRLNQQITRMQHETTKIYELQAMISQLRSENTRLKSNYGAQNEEFQAHMKHYQQEIFNLKGQMNNLHLAVNAKDDQIENLNFNLNRAKEEVSQLKTRASVQENDITDLEGRLSRINLENNRNREAMQDATDMINEKDIMLNRLRNQNRELLFFKEEYEQLKSDYAYKEEMLNRYSNDLRSLQMQVQGANVQDKEKWITKLQNELNSVRMEFNTETSMLERRLMQKDQQISRLNYDYGSSKDEAIENSNRISQLEQQIWKIRQENAQMTQEFHRVDMEVADKDRNLSKLSYELSQARDNIQELQINMQHLENTLGISKNQNIELRSRAEELHSQVHENENIINRLSYQNSFNKESIANLELHIEQREQTIARLNNQISELRFEISRHFQQMSEKENRLSSLNFEYTQLKGRFEYLQEETAMKESSLSQTNQEMYRTQMTLNQYEDELQTKNSSINRLNSEVLRLRQEIDIMNNQISSKNQEIHRLNQQIFRRTLEDETKGKEQIHRLTQELSTLKFEVTNLEIQLQSRQSYIGQLKSQMRESQKHIKMVYSEDQYSRIKEQTLKLQREISVLRGEMIDKDFRISQLEGQIQFNGRSYDEERINYQEQIKMMQSEIEVLVARERRMNEQLAGQVSNQKMQEMRFGIKLYQDQIDRLNRIVQQLQQEVETLRTKATMIRSQEERIEENLTTMVLTFAEVQALRDRIQQKENEISEVRKSLVGLSQIEASSRAYLMNQGRAVQNSQMLNQESNVVRTSQINQESNMNQNSRAEIRHSTVVVQQPMAGSVTRIQRILVQQQPQQQRQIVYVQQQAPPLVHQQRRGLAFSSGQMQQSGQMNISQSLPSSNGNVQNRNVQSVIVSNNQANQIHGGYMAQSQVVQGHNQTQVRSVQRNQTFTQQVHPSYHMQVAPRTGNQQIQIVSSSPEYRQISPTGYPIVQTQVSSSPEYRQISPAGYPIVQTQIRNPNPNPNPNQNLNSQGIPQ